MSHLGWLFPIYGKRKNVPNHQPVKVPKVSNFDFRLFPVPLPLSSRHLLWARQPLPQHVRLRCHLLGNWIGEDDGRWKVGSLWLKHNHHGSYLCGCCWTFTITLAFFLKRFVLAIVSVQELRAPVWQKHTSLCFEIWIGCFHVRFLFDSRNPHDQC